MTAELVHLEACSIVCRSGSPLFHAVSRPASALTGDFYLRQERSGGWLFGLGDVAGHGLEAVVYMLMIQEEIERLAASQLPLPALVGELHQTLRGELPGRRFASLVLVELDRAGAMEVVNAGHCPPLLRRSSGEISALWPNGPIVGALPGPAWSSTCTCLGHGDTLLLVSDGVTETTSGAGDQFGMERLRRALGRHGSLSPRALAARILEDVDAFRGATPAGDDTTVLVVSA